MNRKIYFIRNIVNKKVFLLDGEKILLNFKKRMNIKYFLCNSLIFFSVVIVDFKYLVFWENIVKIIFKLLIFIVKKNGEKCLIYMNIEEMFFVKYILLNLKMGKLYL